jgi:hypothetical protein
MSLKRDIKIVKNFSFEHPMCRLAKVERQGRWFLEGKEL